MIQIQTVITFHNTTHCFIVYMFAIMKRTNQLPSPCWLMLIVSHNIKLVHKIPEFFKSTPTLYMYDVCMINYYYKRAVANLQIALGEKKIYTRLFKK